MLQIPSELLWILIMATEMAGGLQLILTTFGLALILAMASIPPLSSLLLLNLLKTSPTISPPLSPLIVVD